MLVVQAVAVLLMGVFLALVKLAGLLLAAGLWLNSTLLDVSQSGMNGFISTGWVVFRDIANLGFVFGIIVIAFATIFRIKSYSASQILWKLVVAALLVNFSLVIMSPFIMVSQNFSDYFLHKVTGSSTFSTSGDAYAVFSGAALQTVSIFNPLDYAIQSSSSTSFLGKIAGAITNFISNIYSTAITEVVGVFLEAVVFLTILALAVIMLIRYFFIAFLMILSPVVWLLWVFPSTSKHFKKWWDEFIKWMIFPPVVLFFLDLALTLYSVTSSAGSAGSKWSSFQNALAGDGGQFIQNLPFSRIMGALMSVAMLIGGMIVASKIGVVGGEMATGMAQKTANYTKGKAKEYGARGAKAAKDSGVGKNALAKVKGVTNRVPLVGSGIARSISRGEASIDKRVKESDEAKLAGMSDKNRAEAAKSIFGSGKYTAMAKAIEDGFGGSYTPEELQKLFNGLKGMGRLADAQRALRARGLDEATLGHLLAGDKRAFLESQSRVVSSMNSSERELWMKNDGKNIAEKKYLNVDPSWAGDVQSNIYKASYNDPATMRSMAGNIQNASDREKYLLGGVPGKITEYEGRIAQKTAELSSLTTNISALDAKKSSGGALSPDEQRTLDSLVKRRGKLGEEVDGLNRDIGKVRAAVAGGDVTEIKKAMELSSDAGMKSYANGMKLMG